MFASCILSLRQKNPIKPLTPEKAKWEIERLSTLHNEGILDSEDYGDARAKIMAKIGQRPASAVARPAQAHSRSGKGEAGHVLSADEFARAKGLMMAMQKLKHAHAKIEKALQSPWRQDKKALKDKEQKLTEQMAKLETAESQIKKKFQSPAKSTHYYATGAGNAWGIDEAAGSMQKHSSDRFQAVSESSHVDGELHRALGDASSASLGTLSVMGNFVQ